MRKEITLGYYCERRRRFMGSAVERLVFRPKCQDLPRGLVVRASARGAGDWVRAPTASHHFSISTATTHIECKIFA